MGWIFSIFLIGALVLFYQLSTDEFERITSLAALGIMFLLMIYFFLKGRSLNPFASSAIMTVATFAFFLLEIFWLGILVAVVDLLFVLSVIPKEVRVSEQQVVYPALIPRSAPWNSITNLVLKDGLITIDFTNNKIFQAIIDEKQPPVNEREFNEFCRQQLQR